MGLVAMKGKSLGLFASFTASHAVLMSFSLHLHIATITGTYPSSSHFLPTSCAIIFTPLKSSCDAQGNPASITSTPSFTSCRAIRSFCSAVMAAPGACSPSRRVVSKMRT
ncbi:hypothetical protein PHAVU_001G091700 [Phaseolus vulgaris]|uniref:Uncharacterized protein n=1 Tax=Phaseolus vulgaris TaxID=3885 RepID=V7CWH6_PHAVU|nr:hypothetical protein PHAVU_001G091700g [Phaseolus vulgaris]ESW33703.1 hypothetical protein PHAVU_001G091700g [Phaseolus vulgaris]